MEQHVEPQSLKKLTLKSLKRSLDLFATLHAHIIPPEPRRNMICSFKTIVAVCNPWLNGGSSVRIRIACKVQGEYKAVKDLANQSIKDVGNAGPSSGNAGDFIHPAHDQATGQRSEAAGATPKVIGSDLALAVVPAQSSGRNQTSSESLAAPPLATSALMDYKPPERYQPSAAVMRRLPSKWPRPVWHAPWKNYRVISGHLGWIRSVAFSPSNEWFCTGSADRTIKIWDLASGQLKLTLTGHIEQVRGLAVSPRFPYLFSAGDDKQVKCWDLEYNKVIRSYHGHLSGVYCLSLHPTLDILLTGGRDSVCRVWDIRTKAQIFALAGHEKTVCSIITQAIDPQVVTGSHDTTIKLWDLAAGKSMATLTYHKKSVRALVRHPSESTFASASADNLKKFRFPKGEFLHNMLSQQRTIVNCMAVNEENVLVSGGDNGSLWYWDWKSGHNFQQAQTIVQPGSLESEAGIYAVSFDVTGTRLVTCEADKTIKMWKEDENATPETHPIHFKPPKDMRRF